MTATLVQMVIPEAPKNLIGDNACDSDKLDAEFGCAAKTILSAKPEPTANLVSRLFSFQSGDFPDELNLVGHQNTDCEKSQAVAHGSIGPETSSN